MIEGMAQVHMTEAEVAGDFAAVLRKIGHGEEVVVDRNGHAVAIIKPADPEPERSLPNPLQSPDSVKKSADILQFPIRTSPTIWKKSCATGSFGLPRRGSDRRHQ